MRRAGIFARAVRGVLGALALGALLIPAAQAGEQERAQLLTYVGSWTGKGTLNGGANGPEPFTCNLFVRRGNGGKLVFSGRCPPLEVHGGMAFNDAAGHYEAAMTSNTDFRGVALGKQSGEDLVFGLRDRDTDAQNNSLSLAAQMAMRESRIAISFEAVLNGEPWSGELTFRR